MMAASQSALYLTLWFCMSYGTLSGILRFQPHSTQDNKARDAGSLFRFASYYSDHMVLQKSPLRSTLWGYAALPDIGQHVWLTVSGPETYVTYTAIIRSGPFSDRAVWSVELLPIIAGGPYVITAVMTSSGERSTLNDVMFGDVWFCSGQSNMVFKTGMMFNGSAELERASAFPHVRLMRAGLVSSATPLYDLKQIDMHWSLPSKDTVVDFSAVCWLYGRKIHEKLNYPIGLIQSAWGGTPIEAWSSPDALSQCNMTSNNVEKNREIFGPARHSNLWNAMVHPLTNFTMYGAIWYQGEANAAHPDTYRCTFPALIADWRQKFNTQNHTLGFGFVQLAPRRNDTTVTTGFPDIRWHQTADVGYVPNALMPLTFMAVAMDLPDFKSPYGNVHPRDKEDVGSRLALAGLSVVYGMKLGQFQGSKNSAYFVDIGFYTLRIEFDNGTRPISVRNTNGYEVCCSHDNQTYCDSPGTKWVETPIISHTSTSVTLSYKPCGGMWIVGLRYAWRESPCPFKQCAVYSVDNELPMAPFITNGIFNADEMEDPRQRG